MNEPTPTPRRATERELIRWAETLSATAQTGLGFTENLYERERFEEVLAIAADIRQALYAAEGVKTHAAKLISMPIRTFSQKLKEYGVEYKPGDRT